MAVSNIEMSTQVCAASLWGKVVGIDLDRSVTGVIVRAKPATSSLLLHLCQEEPESMAPEKIL